MTSSSSSHGISTSHEHARTLYTARAYRQGHGAESQVAGARNIISLCLVYIYMSSLQILSLFPYIHEQSADPHNYINTYAHFCCFFFSCLLSLSLSLSLPLSLSFSFRV